MAKVIAGAESVHSSAPAPSAAGSEPLDDFRNLYLQHYSAVWRFLLHLGVRRSDAADVTHNVFLIAYRKLPSFEHRSSVRTWLCGIALRVGRDFQKSARVRLEVSATDLALAEVGSEDGVEARRHDGQLALAERLLDTLPAEQREVFVLHELEQMTGSEIATLMGTSTGTVRSRLRRARESFQKQLAALKQQGVLDV